MRDKNYQEPTNIIHYEECEQCNGVGYFIDTTKLKKIKCSQCDGKGYIETTIDVPNIDEY